jgi:integrase
MSHRKNYTPRLCLHKASGCGVVKLHGKKHYLGKYGTHACQERYERMIAEWEASGRREPVQLRPEGPSVAELIRDYQEFARGYYQKNGKPTSQVEQTKHALSPLGRLYGSTPAKDFGALALKAVRQKFINAALSRAEVNRKIQKIIRMFKWAVSNELVPASAHHRLTAVGGLKKGRCTLRDLPPVKPVPEIFVDAVLPHVCRQVGAMIRLQRLTGMRPGEVIAMRTMDITMSGAVWEYRPGSHKTEHYGKDRIIFVGPKAQEILKPWLRADLAAYLFSPREATAERARKLRKARRTKVQPSQRNRRKKNPLRAPGEQYRVSGYAMAIRRACVRAGVPHWAPNQLRHNAATQLRREFGLEVARAVLGHSSIVTTLVYAEEDQTAASNAMLRIG